MNITVLYESWRPHPLAWIHRAEARSVAAELRGAGHAARLVQFRDDSVAKLSCDAVLLCLSDPVMLTAVQTFSRVAKSVTGPSARVMERCYDKYGAYKSAIACDIDCPLTILGSEADAMGFPAILKPRRGSDSIGVRLLKQGPLPARFRNHDYILQQQVRGAELTVAVFRDRVGTPLRIYLPEGTPYSFFRKYLLRPARAPLADAVLAERVRHTALKIAGVFKIDWAARIDLIHESATDRLRFLECDAAPLVGARSAFAASFEAAGVTRTEQLRMLSTESDDRPA